MDKCPHGYPTPASCFECMEDGNVEVPKREPEKAVVGPVVATWTSDCPGCGLNIWPGQRVVKTDRDRWMHKDCV